MASPLSSSLCETVQSLLEDIRTVLADIESDSKVLSERVISERVIQLQPVFQEIVARLAEAGFTPSVEQRLRPLQTEGHRRLKLAGIAAMRLQTAKRVETVLAVRAQINEHLLQLQKFLVAIADELGDRD